MLEPPRTTRWTFGKLHVLHVKWRKWDSKVRKRFLLPCLSIVGTKVGSEFFTLCRIPFVLYSLVFFDIDKIFFILISTDDFFFFPEKIILSFSWAPPCTAALLLTGWSPSSGKSSSCGLRTAGDGEPCTSCRCFFSVIALADEVVGCDEAALTVQHFN